MKISGEVWPQSSWFVLPRTAALFLVSVMIGSGQCIAAAKEPVVRAAHANARVTMFQCNPSFSGAKDGIGECAGRLDVSFRGAPAALKAAEFSCEVLLRYWWRDGKEKRWEWKSVQVTAPAAQLGNRFADAVVEFRTDLTSIINEPRGADVKQVQCDIAYQTM